MISRRKPDSSLCKGGGAPDCHATALLQRMVSSIASLARWREALRGLRVLRYEVEAGYVEHIIATRQNLVEAEQHLLLKGFYLGDDGIDPDFLCLKPRPAPCRPFPRFFFECSHDPCR